MTSDQLFQFRAIAELGNITKAANALYLTQPAMSISLSKLETDLGTQLFVRNGKRMELTTSGKKLLEYAVVVTDTIRQAEEYFALGGSSKVALAFIGGINYPLLTRGCTLFENLNFNSFLVRYEDMQKTAQTGDMDLLIADEHTLPAPPEGYTRHLLYRQSLMLLIPAGHVLESRNSIDFAELQEYPLIGHANPHSFNAWLNEIKVLNRCRLWEERNINFYSWCYEGDFLLPFLMNNFGVSTVWNVVRKMKAIPVRGTYTQRDIFLYYRESQRDALAPLIEKIQCNAEKTVEMDRDICPNT